MKEVKIPVTRILSVPGQADIERKTTVTFRHAESTQEMLELTGQNLAKVLDLFNSGRWAELRTKVSNKLANKSPEQRAVDKLIDAYKTINPTLDDGAIRAMVLSMPGMKQALESALESVPTETDEAFYAKSADEPADAPAENGAEGSEAPKVEGTAPSA